MSARITPSHRMRSFCLRRSSFMINSIFKIDNSGFSFYDGHRLCCYFLPTIPEAHRISSGGNVMDAVITVVIRYGEERIIEDEDGSIHVGMDVAVYFHHTGFIEVLQFFLSPRVTPQIEFSGLGVGENIVEEIVVIRKIHGRADQHRQDEGTEEHL